MDKLTFYRQYIQQLLTEQTEVNRLNPHIEMPTVFDVNQDRYLLINLGWDDHRLIYFSVIHLDIKDGKIWIQRNQTDRSIADDLISMGVNKEDIILGVQPPYLREYTMFAVWCGLIFDAIAQANAPFRLI